MGARMRIFVSILAAAAVVTAISGCAASAGAAATAQNQCQITHDALAKVVVGSISAPYKRGKICYFGIGKNSGKHGAPLGLISNDVVQVAYKRTDVASLYRAATGLPGTKPLDRVGSAAEYWDRSDGNAQVFARTSDAFCWVIPDFSSATEAGLDEQTGARIISKADVPVLAAKLGGVCTALFG
jgi:hypothetical protein